MCCCFFFFKQKTAYEMRISDWSSDVCSSDLAALNGDVDVGDRFSIVIPTKVERNEQSGAIPNWIPQTGREIVVAHGLDPLQAARALKAVSDAPDQFVSKSELHSGLDVREIICTPLAVPDKALKDRKSTRLNSSH